MPRGLLRDGTRRTLRLTSTQQGVGSLSIPRVALFPDSFHEVNGVATTSRQFARFAQERGFPFFCVHTGPATRHVVEDTYQTYEISNSSLALRLQADMSFDLLFFRYRSKLEAALSRFQPDIVHVTGPSHCGLLGLILAHDLGVPVAASWHTNLHEYAARRLHNVVRWLPAPGRENLLRAAERLSLSLLVQLYRLPRLLFAPNPELVHLLASRTGKQVHLMVRGIDTNQFSPAFRSRSDSTFVIGYVGRLSPEKNVRIFADLEQILLEQGLTDYRFLIVGDGSERTWLQEHMQRCELTGLLRGTDLAQAYANMDVFVFPSITDTFGNVILEALASGVPSIVGTEGGPKFLVEQGVAGFVAKSIAQYGDHIGMLHSSPAVRQQMSAMRGSPH